MKMVISRRFIHPLKISLAFSVWKCQHIYQLLEKKMINYDLEVVQATNDLDTFLKGYQASNEAKILSLINKLSETIVLGEGETPLQDRLDLFKGLLENTTNRWQNVNGNSHNEYYGTTTPMIGGSTNCIDCHDMDDQMKICPTSNTISGFCASCHQNFHILADIGGDNTSPFIRHPTDVVLKATGEYSAYTAYSTEAPVARPTVYDNPSSTVTPGTDVVMCLSCHGAHGTDYPDILRWDYTDMIAGDTSKSGGCFTCHTQKNQTP
jgi:predicted CXXCH cytochrome family protein